MQDLLDQKRMSSSEAQCVVIVSKTSQEEGILLKDEQR